MNKKTISEYKMNRDYPIKVMVKLTGRKTLKRSDINEIKLLGFDIEILPTVSDLRMAGTI